ncbi:hypothetical protein HID58_091003 [Brassica napus]|uniref:Uncharacterized protein n=1 Tax=Brassica napus TaxID=3708 RepID=A0ABQ7X702_BRANA|nr:hypothetical protein HID58_091003 [Brassica napus]
MNVKAPKQVLSPSHVSVVVLDVLIWHSNNQGSKAVKSAQLVLDFSRILRLILRSKFWVLMPFSYRWQLESQLAVKSKQ